MTQNTATTLQELRKFCDISELPAILLKSQDFLHIEYTNNSCHSFFTKQENIDSFSTLQTACLAKDTFIHNIIISLNKEESLWADISISYRKIDEQEYILLQIIDITEHKKAESKIRDVADEAEMMSEIKSDFLATMSHEIRTPMQSVYGMIELILEEDNISENVSAMALTAKKSASGLLEILDDVLDLAKVNAGKMELDMFEVPVRTLAYGTLECMEVKLQGKNVKFIAKIDEDVPFVVMGDPTRLRQILLNLIGNAMKFTETGSITLHITKNTEHIDIFEDEDEDDGIALRFEIIDTGIGMPQEIADKLFQPFIQADNSTSRKFGGTGLGLSICHKLIELMGGEIGVNSIENKGSTFWFEIPTEALGTETHVELPDLDGLAVLSIEDHPAGAREIKSSLQSMGAKVESCATFKEGMELIKQRPFDVAVIDQGLPDGLGIDIAKEASKTRPFMGLIIYTVRDDIGLQHSAKSLGATYLTKPASRLGLGEAVKSATRKTTQNISHRPKRLLIAEDTASVRDVIQRQLDKLGVDADFVENGVEALKMLEKQEHGILFTDLHMPDMDGYELTSKLRDIEENESHEDRFPIIALTADVQLAQRQAYLSHGFDECLLKPISLGQLRQLLIRWGLLQEKESITKPQTDTIDIIETNNDDIPPPIIKEDMIKQMGSFDASTIDMLRMFVDMTKENIDNTKKAFEEQNIPALIEEAHSLKGAARSACCNHLGDIAHSIQDISEQGRLVSEQDIKNMVNEFNRVKNYIEKLAKEFQ